jgi:LacI family transcriptional regulator
VPVSRSVTLRQIAAACGFCKATISLALRGDRTIPEQTRAQIVAKAAELGYRPHPYLSALMAHTRSANPIQDDIPLALITSHRIPSPWTLGMIKPALHKGLVERAQQRGFRIEEFWLRAPGMTARRLSKILYHRGIRGLIVGPLERPRGHLHFDWDQFSAVTIGYSVTRPMLHRVISHHVHGVQLAMRQLRHRGYRRIGFAVTQEADARVDGHFLASYLREQQRLRSSSRVPVLLPPLAKWTIARFRAWLEKHRPDAIICTEGPPVWAWLEVIGDGLGFRPRLTALYGDLDSTADCCGVHQSDYEIGVATIDVLADLLHRNERGLPEIPRTLLVEPVWVEERRQKEPAQANA